ncbi:hypothetical protein HOY82DRAFT_563367 [Tuber indicum]|nr:hypothetical protein HOY82DRAFT_563367 [Tuber indicum]
MSTIQLPDGDIHELPASEPDPAQSTHVPSSGASSDPGLVGTRDPITNQPFAAHSLPSSVIHSRVDDTYGRVRFDSPSNPGAAILGAIRTGTWRVEEGGRLVENVLVLTPDGGPEPINIATLPDIPSDSQENSHSHSGGNGNYGSDESGDLEVMWYEGEEYFEERRRDNTGRVVSSIFLPLLPDTLETIRNDLAGRATTTTTGDRGQRDNTAPTFLNAAGEIDINLIPHAPRTDLPPPPPLIPLPRLTEEPPATWFEGMSEDSRCPVMFQPDYVVDYSFPCGHALCRWCYEQICLLSSQPVCPLCRRRI